MQSRLHSFIEVIAGICIGFSISVLAGRFIYPLYGMTPSWGANAAVTGWFTVISLVRGYCVRRLFNWVSHRKRSPPPELVITSRGSLYRSVRSVVFPRK